MIQVMRLDQEPMFLNPAHIEQIVETPDTVVTLVNGKKLVVADRAADLVSRIMDYWNAVHDPEKKEIYLKALIVERSR